MEHTIRTAVQADAVAACDVVRRSIMDLCVEDHGGDPATIGSWLSNKTPDRFRQWIGSGGNFAVVAERSARVVGFGLATREGHLALLYVAPEARFRGISKALLRFIEDEARRAGVRQITLESTSTARRFYERCGFVTSGDPAPGFGIAHAYPMAKRVAP